MAKNALDIQIKVAVFELFALYYESMGYRKFDQHQHVVELIDSELGHEHHGKQGLGKKEKLSMISHLRKCKSTLESRVPPSNKSIRVGQWIVKMDNWKSIVRYSAFKHVLKGGIVKHLDKNPTMREFFDVEPFEVSKGQERLLNMAISNQRLSKKHSQGFYD